MKKIFVIITVLIVSFSACAYSAGNGLIDMRNKIFEEAKAIKPLMTDSKDAVLISSIWDCCILTVTQLDAYFSMIAIFNNIKGTDSAASSVDYLTKWLYVIKNTNESNIKGILAISKMNEEKTKAYTQRLKEYFEQLNTMIDNEAGRISVLKKTAK